MQQLILIIHVLIAIALISLVLIQHGKGADVGASFGSGAANSMFGSLGPASFLMKLTSTLGILFFITSIVLGLLVSRQVIKQGQLDFMLPSSVPVNSVPANAAADPVKDFKTTNTREQLSSLSASNTLPKNNSN